MDGKDIYVLDYAHSTQNLPLEELGIRAIRDEIREVSPGIFVGPVLVEFFGFGAPTSLYFAVFTSASGLVDPDPTP